MRNCEIGVDQLGCYNAGMTKEDSTKKDAADKDKKTDDDKDAASGSKTVDLEATKTKKGEPDDNLGRRAEWFQKRHGGGGG
ncbi:MAG: hypothetical protein ABJC10_08100 [Acidobacteriota bacterium]